MKFMRVHAAGRVLHCGGSSVHALAQPAQDVYKGKQIRMIVGHPVGNDYDLGGRFLAKYLTKHIPGNPLIVVSEHAGGVEHRRRQFLLQPGAARRHGVRLVLAQHPEPGADAPGAISRSIRAASTGSAGPRCRARLRRMAHGEGARRWPIC